ncbi:unnamed protein product [Blepharisma stoltei]|uniref:Uncharacterized protein n=1 Tax=Blepharisma stoltei TaxID=1481888 RepID=A0AAU9IMK9_9CILI|nr:unnamed protein product [Blepharisma stoltei]
MIFKIISIPDYELIAYTFRNVGDIAILKIDAYHNSVKGHFVEDFPTIKYFPANNKNGILFQNDLNYESIFQFIKEHSSFNFGSKNVKFDL